MIRIWFRKDKKTDLSPRFAEKCKDSYLTTIPTYIAKSWKILPTILHVTSYKSSMRNQVDVKYANTITFTMVCWTHDMWLASIAPSRDTPQFYTLPVHSIGLYFASANSTNLKQQRFSLFAGIFHTCRALELIQRSIYLVQLRQFHNFIPLFP